MASFELEEAPKGRMVQLPCDEQSPVQPDLESLHRQGFHHLSRQPVPVPYSPYCKKLLLVAG